MRNCLTEARWQVFLLLWAVLLLAAGCGGEGPPLSPFTVDTIDGVWIEAKEGSVTSTGMEILLHNQAKREDLHYGVTFYLEEERDGQWYTCPPIPPHVPGTGPLIAYDILPDEQLARSGLEENSHTYDWTYSYGKLPLGNYRLLLEVSSALDAPTGIYPCYYLSAPFTVEHCRRDPTA